MKIVFMGTPDFAVVILEALAKKYDVGLVVSQPNRVRKKGVLIDTSVSKKAKELKLDLIQPEKIIESYEQIKNVGADVLITAAYGQYIPTKILNLFKYTLNVHASLLPKHRGGAPIQRALINGDEYSGVSIMKMTKKLDAGLVYAVKKYKIEPQDNATTLFEKLSYIGKDLLLDCIEDIYNGKNQGVEQDDSLATYSPNILPEEEKINLNDTSVNIVNKIRGLAMDPGAYILVNNVKLKIFRALVVDYKGNEPAGSVIDVKKQIVIKTKDSAINLDLVLLPGKKMMTGRDFANGQKIFKVNDVIM